MDAKIATGFRLHPVDDSTPASKSRPAPVWRLILLAASLVALVALPALAQQADQPEPMELLSRSWSDFYSAKPDYEKIIKRLAPLANRRETYVRESALHCMARAYWAAGTQASRSRAKTIWAAMERSQSRWTAEGFTPISSYLGRRTLIGQAVMLAGEGKHTEAIKKLEPFRTVSPQHSDVCIAESLLLFAELLTTPIPPGAGRPPAPIDPKRLEEADKCLKQAEDYLAFQTGKEGELNATIVRPFAGAIKAARKRLADMKKETLTPGLPIFEKAEQMRRQQKWAEAAALYRKVVEVEPQADYAHQSGYLIGVCTLGLKRPDLAARQWEQFIAATPAGPHRGSAFVALADLYLDELMDLTNAGKYADLARSALPTALADDKAAPSWRGISYDVNLRVGLISLCTGKGDMAAEAFAAARKLTTNKLTAEGLDALIAAAKTGKPVIPEDCLANPTGQAQPPSAMAASPSAKVAVALSMGVIYTCSGRLDKADAYFERVLGKPGVPAKPGVAAIPAVPPMPGASKAQAAFAVFGQGAVLHARRKLDEAKEAFVESYKAFPSGTWNDETLYRIATIMQVQADAKFPASAKPGAEGSAAAHPKSKEQWDKEAKAEKDRIAARLLARGEATPYWEEILKRWLTKGDDGKLVSQSGRVEDALYNLGVLQYDLADASIDATGKPLPSDKLDAAWKSAAAMLGRLCELYPRSLVAGDAYIRQIDIALEVMFSLDSADKISRLGASWVKRVPAANSLDGAVSVCAWQAMTPISDASVLRKTTYGLCLRAGLIACLKRQYDQAIEYFKTAGPVDFPKTSVEKLDLDHVGLTILISCAREKRSLTEAKALADAKTEQQQLAIQLADLYLQALRPERAERLFRRIVAADRAFGPVEADIQGYALLQVAVALDRQKGRQQEAFLWLEQLASDKYKHTHWGPYGMFRLALHTYNIRQNPKESMPLYKKMFDAYPDHPMAEYALAYYCMDAASIHQSDSLRDVGQTFMKQYPNSRFAPMVSRLLRDLEGVSN